MRVFSPILRCSLSRSVDSQAFTLEMARGGIEPPIPCLLLGKRPFSRGTIVLECSRIKVFVGESVSEFLWLQFTVIRGLLAALGTPSYA